MKLYYRQVSGQSSGSQDQCLRFELKAGSTGYLLEFNTEFYYPKDHASIQRLKKASNKNYCLTTSHDYDRFQNTLNSMLREFTGREDGYLDVIKASLEIFFVEYARQSTDSTVEGAVIPNYTQERYEEFFELLQKQFTGQKQVSTYTTKMNLSPQQLNEIRKSAVGKTASELIKEHIMLEAKRYLLGTPNQVKEIADLLGYEDPSYFMGFIKKQMGQSPEAFRQSFR